MLINVNQTAINVRKPSAIDALAGRRAFCGEFKYSRDTEIFGEVDSAEYVYQVGKGAVRSYKLLGDGRRQINAFHLPGDMFGVENGDLHRFTAEAVIETTVRIARRRSLFEGISDNLPAIGKVLALVTKSLQHAEDHMLLLGRKTALEKVAAFLTEMDQRSIATEVMTLPMTRRDIADYLGLTLETVARALSHLERQGVIEFIGQANRQIELLDRTKLADLSSH